jgi:hypothetical protein
MTEREAWMEGFTHHGSYYGIPVWMGEEEGQLVVACKYAWLEWVMDVFRHIEQFMRPILYPDEPPVFMFVQKRQIDPVVFD